MISGYSAVVFGSGVLNFLFWALIVGPSVMNSGCLVLNFGFLAWNIGATKVSAEKLALMNNAVIPIAILNSYLIFGEAIGFALFLPGLVLFYVAFKLIS